MTVVDTISSYRRKIAESGIARSDDDCDWAKPVPAIRLEKLGERFVPCLADRPANFDRLIRDSVERHPDNAAFVDGARRVTYRELDKALSTVAANYSVLGVARGDRVAIIARNSLEFMYALFAAMRLGAIAVPLGIRLQTPELSYALQHSGAKVVVFDASLADRLPDIGDVPLFAIGAVDRGGTGCFRAFEELLQERTVPAEAQIDGTDIACIMYTSGTTGRPKGALLPHSAFVHSAMHFEICLGHTHHTRSLLTIPATHISGLGAIVITMLRVGGCTVIENDFKAASFLRTMEREKCTFTVLVPAMYKLCLLDDSIAGADLSAWSLGLFGGAIMPPATIEALFEQLPGLSLVNGYGATETTSPAAVMPIGKVEEYLDSVGLTVPCGDIRIVDDHGRELPVGESGELWIAGPMIASGYWNDEEATRLNFTGGYWHSGDIGMKDENGYVRILDRKKDMINRGGYKIFSAEVENELSKHPDIVEAVVVPSPDPVLGERVHAFVCARNDILDGESIRRFCKLLMADYKVPEIFTIDVAPLPRNGNGKFDKIVLRERARGVADNRNETRMER